MWCSRVHVDVFPFVVFVCFVMNSYILLLYFSLFNVSRVLPLLALITIDWFLFSSLY
jgi:hypothetical protein